MKTQRRRRREAKTDYKSRLRMLKFGKPRLVVRKSNRYVLVQLVSSDIAQDRVIAQASSRELLSLGWPREKANSLKSLVAAYLTGYLLAGKIKEEFKEAILDLGLNRAVRNSRVFAALRGVLDRGVKIPHAPEILPADGMLLRNERTKNLITLKEKL